MLQGSLTVIVLNVNQKHGVQGSMLAKVCFKGVTPIGEILL